MDTDSLTPSPSADSPEEPATTSVVFDDNVVAPVVDEPAEPAVHRFGLRRPERNVGG
jgi:hypothetical protein